MRSYHALGVEPRAFQDDIADNYCWGCGRDNPQGLHIRSFWSGADTAVCDHRPRDEHAAGPREVVNGGIIATLIDCHSICTAIAGHYRREERAIGSDPTIWCVTAALSVSYVKPAPLGVQLHLTARIVEARDRKTTVSCTVEIDGVTCATGEVIAVRVPHGWGGHASVRPREWEAGSVPPRCRSRLGEERSRLH